MLQGMFSSQRNITHFSPMQRRKNEPGYKSRVRSNVFRFNRKPKDMFDLAKATFKAQKPF